MKYLILCSFTLLIGCSVFNKKQQVDENGKPIEPPPLASTHPSGDICNALHLKSPIKYPKVPIGTSEQLIVEVFIEKQHELTSLTASGLYDPLSFYGGSFPGVFPENTFRPCSSYLSSADEAANYCHMRLNFNPHQRKTFRRQLTINYTLNGRSCSRVVSVVATGF